MRCGKPKTVGRRVILLALYLAAFSVTDSAVATDWTAREFAKFRLLPSTTAVDGSTEILIALEIDLEAGWHFYSKHPGEFGVSPKFDWTASWNLARAVAYWPKPTRIVYSIDPPVSVLGYNGGLLLPIVLEAKLTNDDFDVRLFLEYAVCNDYCIVDTVTLGLILPVGEGETTLHTLRLQQALANAKSDTW